MLKACKSRVIGEFLYFVNIHKLGILLTYWPNKALNFINKETLSFLVNLSIFDYLN